MAEQLATRLLYKASLLFFTTFSLYASEKIPLSDDPAEDAMRRFLEQKWDVVEEISKSVEEGNTVHIVGLDLYWDRMYMGQVSGQIDQQECLVAVHLGDFLCALQDRLADHHIEFLLEQQNMEGWLFPECLQRYDLTYDPGLFTVRLRSPPSERDTEFVDLQPRPWMDFHGCLEPEPISGFLNYAHVVAKRGDDDFSYILDTDGAVCCYGWVLEGRSVWDETTLTTNNVRITRDFPDLCTRLTIGETQSLFPRILTADKMQGIQYSTHPELHRNRISYPISEQELFLERDSRVEVWINELQKEVLNLPAGPHNIRNFPLTAGYNQIRLKITDDLGRIEYRRFNSIHSPTLLSPGIKNFTFSVGIEGDTNHYSDHLIGAASWQEGITHHWTARVATRFDDTQQAGLIGSDYALPWCVVGLDVAGSNSGYGQGMALEGSLEKIAGRTFVQARASYRQKDFLSQIEDPSTARTRGLYQVICNHTMPGRWGFLQGTAYRENRWADKSRARIELSWLSDFAKHWTIKAAADYDYYRDRQTGFFVILAYHRVTSGITHRHSVEGREDNIVFRNTGGWVSDWRQWQVHAEHQHQRPNNGSTWDNVSITGRYLGDRFWTSYTGWWDDVTRNGDVSQIGRLEGSIAAVNGYWSFGPPIRNSWALVWVDQEMEDAVYQVTGFGRTSKIGSGKGLVVTQLPMYRKVEMTAEPLEGKASFLESRKFSLVPQYRSGHLLKLKLAEGEEGFLQVKGMIVDSGDQPIPLKGLLFKNTKNNENIYSFTDEKGQFTIVGLAENSTYQVTVIGVSDAIYEVATGHPEKGNTLEVGVIAPKDPFHLYKKG